MKSYRTEFLWGMIFILYGQSPKGDLVMKPSKIRIYTECAIMVALATVLSMLPLVEMPYGGSITVASALPILLFSYRRGIRYGTLAGVLYASLQLLTGLKNLSYFTTWYSILAVIFLDYLIAFTVVGLGGIFRRAFSTQANALLFGALAVSAVRYVLHTIAGATVWAGISIPTGATLVYSISYNATYMLPETIILAISAFYIGNTVDFAQEMPTKVVKKSTQSTKVFLYSTLSGLVAVVGAVIDICLVFPKLQMDDGTFSLTGLANVAWVAFLIVTLVSLALALLFFLLARSADKTQKSA